MIRPTVRAWSTAPCSIHPITSPSYSTAITQSCGLVSPANSFQHLLAAATLCAHPRPACRSHRNNVGTPQTTDQVDSTDDKLDAVVEVISFYRVGDPYGLFSNFAPYPVFIHRRWPTSEHYFQAQKFGDKSAHDAIAGTASPMEAAKLGRSTRWRLRHDWDEVKDDVMRTAVRSKVAQNQVVHDTLLETGDATLVEHTTNDRYWGDGGDGTGRNMLGQILMEVRAEIVGTDAALRGMPPPPWIALPGLGRYDIGWRMGIGEDFICRWGPMYLALQPEARHRYQRQWPEPDDDDWPGYWATEG